MNSYFEIQCPYCWETFSIPGPAHEEIPTDWDYDCEVCCRPMRIRFFLLGEVIEVETRSLEDAD